MKINPKIFLLICVFLWLLSLAVHVSIFLGSENIPLALDLMLTTSMVIIWLLSSRLLKQLHKNQPYKNPLKILKEATPGWLPFLVGFSGLYALFNLGMMIRTRWAGSNLRGISGFWIFFFLLGILIARAQLQIEKRQNP